jgi:hypothetical protein
LEALSVHGRAAADKNGTGGRELYCGEIKGKERLAEVLGRVQEPMDVLERVLVLPQ